MLSLCEEDTIATSNSGEKCEKLDLRIRWQHIGGEAVNADQDTENGYVGQFQIGVQLAQAT